METFAPSKEMEDNPHYKTQREKSLSEFTEDMIDPPIIDITTLFNKRPYCFTMQSCHGHFVSGDRKETHSVESIPESKRNDTIQYRLAYVTFCIEKSDPGIQFLRSLGEIPAINPQNIQLCSAEWFWKRQINSYSLQVMPDRFKDKDSVFLDASEASYIESVRNLFFDRLRLLLSGTMR